MAIECLIINFKTRELIMTSFNTLTNNRRKFKLAVQEAKQGMDPVRAKAKETFITEERNVRVLQLKLNYENVKPTDIRDEYKQSVSRLLEDLKQCPIVELGLTKERTALEATVQATEALIKDLAGNTLRNALSRYFKQLNDLVNIERKIRNI